jgi:hypothetical protein
MMKLEKIKTKKGQAHWHGPLKKPMLSSGRYIIYWVVCPESGHSGWKIKRGWHKNLFSPKNTLETPYKPSLTTY